jgi:hypothetical protein
MMQEAGRHMVVVSYLVVMAYVMHLKIVVHASRTVGFVHPHLLLLQERILLPIPLL